MSRSLARTAVLAALAAVLAVLGVAPALAVTLAPAPGTPECADLVNAQTAVATLQGTLNGAVATLAADQAAGAAPGVITNDTTGPLGVQTLTARLNVLKDTTAKQVCTGTGVVTTTTPATTTPESTSPPVVPVPRVIILPGVLDRDCADFATQADAQAFFLAHGGSPLRNVDNLDANHNGVACEDHFAPAVVVAPQSTTVVTSKTVVATADDGSVPVTSGRQVTEVPSGSAQTGAA